MNDFNPDSQNHDQAPQEHNENHDSAVPKRRLGRGLSALLGVRSPVNDVSIDDSSASLNSIDPAVEGIDIRMVPVSNIQRNPNQPRKHFPKDSQKELAESLITHGVLQPLLVREFGEKFQIVAGERRWLASQQAGLEAIPCRVIDVIDKTACEFALEENLKRQDLGDLEKAQAFKEYIDTFECSVEELAKQLSMSRSAVSNTLRLLDLPVPIKNAMQEGKLTAGHARALLTLGVEDQLRLAQEIQSQGLSVRKTEAAVRAITKGDQGKETIPMESPSEDDGKSNHLKSLEDQLRDLVGAKVQIQQKGKDAGRIIIEFSNNEEFETILDRLREPRSHAA